jgi:hypothetical protein
MGIFEVVGGSGRIRYRRIVWLDCSQRRAGDRDGENWTLDNSSKPILTLQGNLTNFHSQKYSGLTNKKVSLWLEWDTEGN